MQYPRALVSELARRIRFTAWLAASVRWQHRLPYAAASTIERAQRRRLRRIVAHAYTHVPYYGETMKRLGLRPADIATVRDLGLLPVLERATLQRDPEYFASRGAAQRCMRLGSGGSTGEPVTVFHDPFALVQSAAHRERHRVLVRQLAGAGRGYREAFIAVPPSAAERAGEALRELILAPRGSVADQLHLSVLDSPAANAERIDRHAPDVIDSFGSYLDELFLHWLQTGRPKHLPKVVVTSSDALSEPVRRLIVDQLGIPVISVYRTVEAFSIAFQCEHHRGMHVNVDLCPITIVDGDGGLLPAGESGDVLVSNLVNRGTVLLNYRIGDRASYDTQRCPCGRTLPLLSFLEGRTDDWLRSTAGRRVHPQALRKPLSALPGVWRYQVVQRDATRIDLAIVAAPDADRDALRERAARIVRGPMGADTIVRVDFVDDLARAQNGKVRIVVSQVAARVSGC